MFDLYMDLLRHMADTFWHDPTHHDLVVVSAWHLLVSAGAAVGIVLQLVATATVVLLAGGVVHTLARGVRHLGRHSAYGYHRAKLDQAREAGDTRAVERHQLRVYVLADQLDKGDA